MLCHDQDVDDMNPGLVELWSDLNLNYNRMDGTKVSFVTKCTQPVTLTKRIGEKTVLTYIKNLLTLIKSLIFIGLSN